MKLSYGITTHNEADELNKLLEILIHKTDVEDEIVICVDNTNGEDDSVRFVLDSWIQQYAHTKMIKVYQRKLDGDFSAQKNSVIENCTGEYIMHIDCDEQPHEALLLQLKQIIEMNEGIDLIYIPRINTIEGLTEQFAQKWGWRVTAPFELYNEKVMDTESEEYKLLKKMDLIVDENIKVKYRVPVINSPDYQARVFRRDKSIRWTRPLHELITGCKTYAHLPPQEELSLYHPKTIDKQEQQNLFYNQNFSKELNVRK